MGLAVSYSRMFTRHIPVVQSICNTIWESSRRTPNLPAKRGFHSFGTTDRLWFSQISKLLINWELLFFLRFPCSPPLVALAAAFLAFFRQRMALQLEILALRHQLGVLQPSVKRPKLTAADRFQWAWLSAVWEDWQPSSITIKPATVIGWHRRGFRLFWTSKIRQGKLGRPRHIHNAVAQATIAQAQRKFSVLIRF